MSCRPAPAVALPSLPIATTPSIKPHRIPHRQRRLQRLTVGNTSRLQCGYQVVQALNLGIDELQAGELRTGFVGEGVEVVVDVVYGDLWHGGFLDCDG